MSRGPVADNRNTDDWQELLHEKRERTFHRPVSDDEKVCWSIGLNVDR